MIRYIKKNISMVIGLVMFIMIVGLSIFAPFISSHDPLIVNPGQRMQGSSPEHLLGTDFWGRDIFARVVYGGRTSLVIGSLRCSARKLACLIGLRVIIFTGIGFLLF